MAAIPLEFLTKLVQLLTSPCIQGNAHLKCRVFVCSAINTVSATSQR